MPTLILNIYIMILVLMQMVVPALMLTLTNNVDADSSGCMNWNRPLGPQASGKDMDKDTDSQASSALP